MSVIAGGMVAGILVTLVASFWCRNPAVKAGRRTAEERKIPKVFEERYRAWDRGSYGRDYGR